MLSSLEDPEVVDLAASTVPHPFVGGETSLGKRRSGLDGRQFADKVPALWGPLLDEDPIVGPQDSDASGDSGVDLPKGVGLLDERTEFFGRERDNFAADLRDPHERFRRRPQWPKCSEMVEPRPSDVSDGMAISMAFLSRPEMLLLRSGAVECAVGRAIQCTGRFDETAQGIEFEQPPLPF